MSRSELPREIPVSKEISLNPDLKKALEDRWANWWLLDKMCACLSARTWAWQHSGVHTSYMLSAGLIPEVFKNLYDSVTDPNWFFWFIEHLFSGAEFTTRFQKLVEEMTLLEEKNNAELLNLSYNHTLLPNWSKILSSVFDEVVACYGDDAYYRYWSSDHAQMMLSLAAMIHESGAAETIRMMFPYEEVLAKVINKYGSSWRQYAESHAWRVDHLSVKSNPDDGSTVGVTSRSSSSSEETDLTSSEA